MGLLLEILFAEIISTLKLKPFKMLFKFAEFIVFIEY